MAHFPTEFPSAECDLLIDVLLSRGDHATRDIVCATWCLQGYVLDKIAPEDKTVTCPYPTCPPCPDDPAEKVKLLEDLKAECHPRKGKATATPAKAIPWAMLWMVLRQLIEQFVPVS